MKTIQLTKNDFLAKVANYEVNTTEWKYLGDKPALIDFYADWCGPCKMLAPVLEELATEYGDEIYIYKINTEKEQELSAAFGIRSIPLRKRYYCIIAKRAQWMNWLLRLIFQEVVFNNTSRKHMEKVQPNG